MPKDDPNSFMGIFGAMSFEDQATPQILTDDTTYKFMSTPPLVMRSHSQETVCVQDSPTGSIGQESEPPLSRHPSENYEPYDPYDYCEAEPSTSSWDSVNLLLLVCAGPIVFGLPRGFVHVGYLIGSILMVLLILLYTYNMHLVVWTEYQICKIQKVPSMSYPDVLYSSFKMGPRWVRPIAPVARYLLCWTQKMLWFGWSHYSYLFIRLYLQATIEKVAGPRIDEAILSPILIIPLLLLCWVPNLKYLACFSQIANLANVMTMVIVLYYVTSDPLPWLSFHPIGNHHAIPQFIGVILLSIKSAAILMPIKNQMKRPGDFDGEHSVLMSTYSPICLIYPCFSLICALRYGSDIRLSVLENLPEDSFTNLTFILVTVAYMLQFPLIMYVPFDLIWNTMLKERKKKIRAPKFWEYTLRTVLVLLSYLLSAEVANITVFVAACGTIATSVDSFLLPAIMQTLVLWKTSQRKSIFCCTMVKNAFVIAMAVVLIILGVFDCVHQIIKNHDESTSND